MPAKEHSTNYFNAFIEVAEDCPVPKAELPADKGGEPTVAGMQYEMISKHPYRYTSDDVIFEVYARRKGFAESEFAAEREKYFSKGQACMRASALGKRYGWGVHSDAEGCIAIYPVESEKYNALASDPQLNHYKAMRSKRA